MQRLRDIFNGDELRDKFKTSEMYRIKDVRLPLLDDIRYENLLFFGVYQDTYWSYVNCNDRYDEETFDRCDRFLPEGLYGLVNDSVNVTVEPGDIVIDAGSWIGDFAAYASVSGASAVYAFEPTEQNFEILQKTAELNKNIIPVHKGLSNVSIKTRLYINTSGNSAANTLCIKGNETPESSETVETVRLDDFVRENNIQRVDFIKADIEGFERHMLAGAQETLRTFAPKLALCTYHLPDDPQVMAELILKANPKYNIVQKRCKLFASVPE
jgi:FkbM family methyltransferase